MFTSPQSLIKSAAVIAVTIIALVGLILLLDRESNQLLPLKDKQQAINQENLTEPRQVIIVSYQGGGSTFFGGLFNENENAFFVYEPLDSVYVALYGTQEGWNVPTDISSHWNGSQRSVTEQEILATAEVSNALLQCSTSVLPSESLLHKFWQVFPHLQRSIRPYVDCMGRATGLDTPLSHCLTPLLEHCGKRFGHLVKTELCLNNLLRILHGAQELTSDGDAFTSQTFENYAVCLRSMRSRLKAGQCLTLLSDICVKSSLRVIKTVRLSMEGVAKLLQFNPDVKVIHLLRDPRGLVLSRHRTNDESLYGVHSQGKVVDEAQLYCRQLAKDIIKRRDLERIYPGTFLEIIYDEFVTNAVENTQKLFEGFLKLHPQSSVLSWVQTYTKSDIASSWRSVLNFDQVAGINAACKDVFDMVQTDYWPK